MKNKNGEERRGDRKRVDRGGPGVQRGFWGKLKKAHGHRPLDETFLAAFYAAIDPKTPAGAKAILLGAIGYFIVPIDLIPDMLGAMGYTDDLAVILAAIRTVESSITDVHRDRAKAWLERIRQSD